MSTPPAHADLAAQIVDVVIRDLSSRAGFHYEFDALDWGSAAEMVDTLRQKVLAVLEGA